MSASGEKKMTANPACGTTPADQISFRRVSKKEVGLVQSAVHLDSGKASMGERSNEGTLKCLNNSGGKTLIGNYAEDRHVAETLGPQTNYNKAEFSASYDLRGGNKGAVAPECKTMYHNSTHRDDFKPPPENVLSGESRLDALVGQAMRKINNQGYGLS